jgi:prophage antirepressor-like protein
MKPNNSLVPTENAHLLALAFEGKSVRMLDRNGEPWFVAYDVCDILGISFVGDAIMRLDDDQKGRVGVDGLPGLRSNAATVSESGLYELVFRSSKPEAKRFRKWVTSEVLPQIRKTGGYVSPSAAGLSKLETALVDLAREHDGRIAVLESHMRPGDDWMTIGEWCVANGAEDLTRTHKSRLSYYCTAASAKAKLPIGQRKGYRKTKNQNSYLYSCPTFCPRLIHTEAQKRLGMWRDRNAAKAQKGEPSA